MPPFHSSLEAHFDELTDPRREHGRDDPLKIVIIVAIIAVIAGADDWVAVERYCTWKLAWLRTFLDLPKGVPSHDPFRRVFSLLQPDAFQRCVMN